LLRRVHFRLTRRELFALHAEIVAELSRLPEGSPEHHVALGNLRLIRRVLAQPALAP
jgi:hypothetical protein